MLDDWHTRQGFWEQNKTREQTVTDGTIEQLLVAIEKWARILIVVACGDYITLLLCRLDLSMERVGVLQEVYNIPGASGWACGEACDAIEQHLQQWSIADPPLEFNLQPLECAQYTKAGEAKHELPNCQKD